MKPAFAFTLLLTTAATFLPSVTAQDCFCNLFCCISNANSPIIGAVLNDTLAGDENSTPLDPPNPAYDSLRIDNVYDPTFSGCTATILFDFTFVGSTIGGVKNPDQPGDAVVMGTWLWTEAVCNARFCIEGLNVTMLQLDNSPDPTLEAFAEFYINNSFDDPECFEDEESIGLFGSIWQGTGGRLFHQLQRASIDKDGPSNRRVP